MSTFDKNTRRFFYHYNKPLSKKLGKIMWSVHFKGTCYFTEEVRCLIPSFSKSNKRQPYAVMQGFATKIVRNSKSISIL